MKDPRPAAAMAVVIMLVMFALAIGPASARAEVPTAPADICPILAGETVPSVTLRTPEGHPFDLAVALATKPTILIVYRGGWCPYCNLHLGQIQKVEKDLIDLGYQILAISPDRPEKLVAAAEESEVGYTLLSDSRMEASRALGLAFRVDDETVAQYKTFGIDLEADSGETHHLLPVPAALVVGRDGVVRYAYVNPDYKTRIDPDVLVAAARAALP